jgi:hypothetical protein
MPLASSILRPIDRSAGLRAQLAFPVLPRCPAPTYKGQRSMSASQVATTLGNRTDASLLSQSDPSKSKRRVPQKLSNRV